jgi:hypothetical protein
MSEPVKAVAVGVGPSQPMRQYREVREPLDICNVLVEWAKAADVESPRAGKGYLAIGKSDLLNRLIYGGERGASQTPCPVHKGRWSGCHSGWPGSVWRNAQGETPMEVDSRLQEWWDAGCRCSTHIGSGCTTGWNPDEHCCGGGTE